MATIAGGLKALTGVVVVAVAAAAVGRSPPGRPNGRKGWIAQRGTVLTTTTSGTCSLARKGAR
jgi:hypothetical protein